MEKALSPMFLLHYLLNTVDTSCCQYTVKAISLVARLFERYYAFTALDGLILVCFFCANCFDIHVLLTPLGILFIFIHDLS